MRRTLGLSFSAWLFVAIASTVSLPNARSEPFRVQSNPNATFNYKSFNPNAIRRVTQPTCEQRKDHIKNEVMPRTWVYRQDIGEFFDFYYVDCTPVPPSISPEACKTESEKLASSFSSLAWDYFSKLCDVKSSPDGNPEKDVLNCEKYISNYNASKPADYSDIQDVTGVLSRSYQNAETLKDATYLQLLAIVKPQALACGCGDGAVDKSWEECDPGNKDQSAYCTADCKIVSLQKGLDVFKKIEGLNQQKTIKLFPDLYEE